MDTQAHLLSLGWAGPGHPLHPSAYKQKGQRGLAYDPKAADVASKTAFATYPSNGLIKPLLISQKQGRLGIGKKEHEPQKGNEWWLKGFERALSDIGKSESERSSGTSTPVPTPRARRNDAGKFGALYSFFVSGGEMRGTIEDQKRGKKRKSDVLDENAEEKKFEEVAEFMAARDKDEKRRRKMKKQSADEEFKAVEAYMEVRDGKPKKKRKSEQPEAMLDPPQETKEERRERRRQRREKKEARKAVQPQINGRTSSGDEAAKALRKAEKKRRKAEEAARQPTS